MASRHHQPATRSRRAGGWNLIELLVVVAIIVILLAIIVNTAVEKTGPKEQTKIILNGAKSVYEEYFSSTGTTIDPQDDTIPENTGIEKFVYKVKQNKAAFDILMTLGDEAVGGNRDGVRSISDAWGNALRYGYNVTHGDQYREDDVLPQTQNEAVFGSAGPDGEWGQLDRTGQPTNKHAQDNLYSELNR